MNADLGPATGPEPPPGIHHALARARALLEVDRRSEAARVLGLALARQPDHAEALALLAFCHLRDDPSRALEIAERAVAADPDFTGGYEARVDALRELGRAEEAVAAASAAVRLAPDAYEMHWNLAWCLHDLGGWENLKRARHHTDIALSLAPDDPGVHVLDGAVHAEAGDPQDARRAFERALARRPDDPDAHRHLAWLDLNAGRTSQAAHGFTETIRALRGGQLNDPAYLADFDEALRAWLWQRFYRLGGLTLLAAVVAVVVEVPRPVGLGLAVAVLAGSAWRLRRSWRALPPVARRLLPGRLRRPVFATAPLLTLVQGAWLVAVLTVPIRPALLGPLLPAVLLVVVYLAGFDPRAVPGAWRDFRLWLREEGLPQWREEWRAARRGVRED